MESSPVPKEIIVRGKKVFLLLWEYLAGNAPIESVSRYIDTDADRLDRIESVYAIFYGVNTKISVLTATKDSKEPAAYHLK